MWDLVAQNPVVDRHQNQAFQLRLGHQQPVKWVPMVKGQRLQAQNMCRLNRKQLGTERRHVPWQILGGRLGKRQLAYLHFGDDLP